MRAYIVLCIIALASAAEIGYDYHPEEVAAPAPEHSGGEAVLSQPISEPAPQVIEQPQIQEAPQAQPAPLVEEFQKEFYTFSAPEDQFDDGDADQVAGAVKRSIRVVFVRTPENKGLERAALSLAQQASDDRTAIYVLHKQADIANLAKQLQALKSLSRNKPEVHFIKYRTPQDAANAQSAIQNQYNELPGVSRVSNEGTAPVLNFASQPQPVAVEASAPAPAPAPAPAAPSSEYLPSNPAPSQDYLPPSLRRFRLK